jgi:hypothetical protein
MPATRAGSSLIRIVTRRCGEEALLAAAHRASVGQRLRECHSLLLTWQRSEDAPRGLAGAA